MDIRASNGIIEYFSATSTTNPVVNLSDAAIGDVRLLVCNFSPNGTGTVPTTPTITGWSLLFAGTPTGASSNSLLCGFYREVQSGDTLTSATLAITLSQTACPGTICTTVEGVDLAQILDASSPTPGTGTGNAVSPTITTVTDNAFVFRCAINDGAPGFVDGSIPASTTLIGTMANNPPSNGMNLGVAYSTQVTAGSAGTATWGNGASEEYVGATFAVRPSTAGIDSVTPSEFDMDESSVTIAGLNFGATIGTGTVYISDVATLAGSANEVEIANGVNTWSDTSINLDLTGLNATELANLHTLGPSATRYVIVVTNASDEYGSGTVILHRPEALKMSASASISASGEATTARLTAPATKTTGDFVAGRIQDDENPADTVDITSDNYTEMVWSIEAKTLSREVAYIFRVTDSGTPLDTYTVTPQLTISAAATLDAGSGTFTLTGTAASLLKDNILSAGSGSFSLTGTAASLLKGSALDAEAGSYTLTGTAADLLKGSVLDAGTGSFTVTGTASNLLYDQKITVESGSFTVTGTAATLIADRVLSCESGSFVETGQDVTLLKTSKIIADPGSYTLTGSDADLLFGTKIGAGSGSYVLTGQEATLLKDSIITAGSGAFDLTGSNADLLLGRVLGAGSGAFALTGQAANLLYSGGSPQISAESGSFVVTGTAADLLVDRVISAGSGSYTLTGQDTSLELGALLNAESGSFAITGTDAVLLKASLLSAESASYTLTGQGASLLSIRNMVAGSGSYTVTGSTATLIKDSKITADTGVYILTGSDVTLIPSGVVLATVPRTGNIILVGGITGQLVTVPSNISGTLISTNKTTGELLWS